jgi:tRNA(Arg) A34 adenosine deaminase TadA
MNRHNLYIHEAIIEAKKCTMLNKHGCVIVHRTNIISRGHNSNECSNYNKHSIHAEVAAINNMKKSRVNVENMVMYVVRINNKDLNKENDQIRTQNSKPCMDCMKCITHHKVKKVYFTSMDEIYEDQNLRTFGRK